MVLIQGYNPAQIIAVYNNDKKETFTIGIKDDVTNLSLDLEENPNTTPEGTISCKLGVWCRWYSRS